jgi:hypothetical protein
MDKKLLQAFQRIEKKVADQEEQVRREERAREQAAIRAQQMRRKRFFERLALGATLGFSIFVLFLAWYSDGAIMRQAAGVVRSITLPSMLSQGSDAAGTGSGTGIDCTLPQTKNSRYCMDLRKVKVRANWNGISLYADGKEHPFALHPKESE